MNYEIDFEVDDEYSALIEVSSMQKVAELTLSACKVEDASLTIVVTSDEEVRMLNREYRNMDAATDVLSFPNQETLGGDEDENIDASQFIIPEELREETERFLGDIIIAYPYTLAQAAKYGVPIASELRLMTAHGVLHLLGYDHITAEEEEEMWQLQTEILNSFGDQIDLSQRVYDEEEK